jgi:hypothetical protein
VTLYCVCGLGGGACAYASGDPACWHCGGGGGFIADHLSVVVGGEADWLTAGMDLARTELCVLLLYAGSLPSTYLTGCRATLISAGHMQRPIPWPFTPACTFHAWGCWQTSLLLFVAVPGHKAAVQCSNPPLSPNECLIFRSRSHGGLAPAIHAYKAFVLHCAPAGASLLAAPFIAQSLLADSPGGSFSALLAGFALSEAWRAPGAIMIRSVAPQELGSTASALYLCIR